MNYNPSLEQVLDLAGRGDNNLVPVFRDVPADLETPVSAFLKVARGRVLVPPRVRRRAASGWPATASSARSRTASTGAARTPTRQTASTR